MKKNNFLLVALIVFLCQCSSDVDDEGRIDDSQLILVPSSCFPVVRDHYKHPVVLHIADGSEIPPYSEAVKWSQLPKNILNTISSPGLLDALALSPGFEVLSYISSDPTAINWHQEYKNYNSAKELLSRKNSGNALVVYYRNIYVNCNVHDSLGVKVLFAGLEYMFTTTEVLNTLTPLEKKEAVTALLNNYEIKSDYTQVIVPIVFIIYSEQYAPLMAYAQENPEEFNNLLDGNFISFEEQIDLIISIAKRYINDL